MCRYCGLFHWLYSQVFYILSVIVKILIVYFIFKLLFVNTEKYNSFSCTLFLIGFPIFTYSFPYSFLVFLRIFSTTRSSVNKMICSLLSNFYFFFSLFALAESTGKMLNRSDEGIHPCLFHILSNSVFTSVYNVTCKYL